jgi:polyhydroxybutyrate depolymerase
LKLKNLVSIFLAGCIVAISGYVLDATAASNQEQTMYIGDRLRHYLLHIPSAAANQPMPMVIVLHGGGGTARYMKRKTGFDALGDQHGFIVVYPQGIDRHWNDGRATIKNKVDDVEFIATLIGEIERHHPVDSHRIYATGISNGALFAERLACELSDTIAAIAPVAGSMPNDIEATCKPARPVSVLQIDGTDDPIMPYKGGEVYNFGDRGEGGKVISVADTVQFWSRIDECKETVPTKILAPQVPSDPTRVNQTVHRDCRGGSEVILDSIDGGGHTWPGADPYLPEFIVGGTSRQLDTSAAIIDFFLSHPRQ